MKTTTSVLSMLLIQEKTAKGWKKRLIATYERISWFNFTTQFQLQSFGRVILTRKYYKVNKLNN